MSVSTINKDESLQIFFIKFLIVLALSLHIFNNWIYRGTYLSWFEVRAEDNRIYIRIWQTNRLAWVVRNIKHTDRKWEREMYSLSLRMDAVWQSMFRYVSHLFFLLIDVRNVQGWTKLKQLDFCLHDMHTVQSPGEKLSNNKWFPTALFTKDKAKRPSHISSKFLGYKIRVVLLCIVRRFSILLLKFDIPLLSKDLFLDW